MFGFKDLVDMLDAERLRVYDLAVVHEHMRQQPQASWMMTQQDMRHH